MKKTIIIFTAFLSINFSVTAQINKDSLWALWRDSSKSDTTRLNALYKFTWDGYVFSQPDSAFYFAQLQYDLAKSKGLKKQLANAIHIQGVSLWVRGDHNKAKAYFIRTIPIREEINHKYGIASSLNSIGLIYQEQSDYATAIGYYIRCLTISKEIESKKLIAISLNNIGIIYDLQGDYANAIDYYTRSLSILESIGNKRQVARALNNIGMIYQVQHDHAKALDYNERSLTIKEEIGDKKGISSSLTNIGDIYEAQGDSARFAGNYKLSRDYYIRALDYQKHSLAIAEDVGDNKAISIATEALGSVYYKQGNHTKAIKNNYRALKLAREIGDLASVRDVRYQLYQVYKATGRIESALQMHEIYITIRDSIDSEENQRAVIRQEYKYEYDKKVAIDSIAYVEQQKTQDAKLEKSKTQSFALIGGLILLFVFLSLLYKRYRLIKKQKSTILIQNTKIESSLNKLKSAQTQLIQSEKMASLGVLTAGIAHEINNPINFISSGVHSLDKDFKDLLHILNKLKTIPLPEEALKERAEIIRKLEEEYAFEDIIQFIPQTIEDIKEGVNRTAEIIKGLLLYSRSNTSEQQMADIHEDIDTSLVLLRDRYKDHIEIIKHYDLSIGKIKCFHGQLSQVFTNFIDNAIDAIENKGIITITTELKNKQVKISIRDTGEGISKDILTKIFDPFFTTKEVGKGTGLGLSICQGIINNHGGKIQVKSKLKKGSEFIIILPINLK